MSRYRALLHQQLVQYLDCKQETVTFVITVFLALHSHLHLVYSLEARILFENV